MVRFFVTIMVAVAAALPAAAAAEIRFERVGAAEASHAIVIRKDASPSERRAADELRVHLGRAIGAEPRVVTDDGPLPAKAILVGYVRHLEALGVKVDPAALGDEGFALRTSGPHVVVAGSGVRGAMYGATTLLEKLGVRWYTPTVTVVPAGPTVTLGDLDETHLPAFEYREAFFTEAWDKDWAARLRLNGNHPRLDESTGGKVRYRPFAHSFEELVPRSLFERHPEYFPLIKGKRTGGYVQRCLTNPDVLKLTIAKVRQWIKEDPGATLYSVTQNDCYNFCECEKCNEIAAKYGGQSGLYLWFVNQLAEDVARDHPTKLIDTFAYQFTEAPPKGIVPRENVRVRLCPIACCQAHPFERCASQPSVAFVKNLQGWAAITKTLYIWDYNTNFRNYLLPFPDFGEFPAAARLYKRLGVKGVFFQGAYGAGGGGSDAELRSYVMAKLLWDPSLDADALVSEWMRGVYGPAFRPMRAWFDLVHEGAKRPDRHVFIFDSAPVHYLGDDVLAQGDKLFDEAEKLAAGNETAARHVRNARLWLRYAKLASHPAEGPELDAFLADVRKAGIKRVREHDTVEAWEKEYRARAKRK